MRIHRYFPGILTVLVMTWSVSFALAATQFPCSQSIITSDEGFIPFGARVCFKWMERGAGSVSFSEELLVRGGGEYLSFVVRRAGVSADIRYSANPVHAWLPGAYRWVAKGATDWGEQLQLELDLGIVEYMTFKAGDGAACLGFRLYYGRQIDWARMRISGAYCDAERDSLGEAEVRRIFEMVQFEKGDSEIYKYFVK